MKQRDLMSKYAVRTIVGGRGSGKSTAMIGEQKKNIRGMIQDYVVDYKMRCIIIDPTEERDHPADYNKLKKIKWRELVKMIRAGKFKAGVIRTIISTPEEGEEFMWALLGYEYNEKRKPVEKHKPVREMLVVVDDSAIYVPQAMEKTAWERFGLETKNKHNSVAYMFHGWQWIPPRLVTITNEFEIFKVTADTPQDRGVKNRDVLAAYERVMAHENKYYHETVTNA